MKKIDKSGFIEGGFFEELVNGKVKPIEDDGFVGIPGTIQRVRCEIIDGHPQLLVDIQQDDGKERIFILNRQMAWGLTRIFGHHPLVEEFFRLGKGLQ